MYARPHGLGHRLGMMRREARHRPSEPWEACPSPQNTQLFSSKHPASQGKTPVLSDQNTYVLRPEHLCSRAQTPMLRPQHNCRGRPLFTIGFAESALARQRASFLCTHLPADFTVHCSLFFVPLPRFNPLSLCFLRSTSNRPSVRSSSSLP